MAPGDNFAFSCAEREVGSHVDAHLRIISKADLEATRAKFSPLFMEDSLEIVIAEVC